MVDRNLGHDGWTSNTVHRKTIDRAESERVFRKFADYAHNDDAYRGRTGRDIRAFELTKR
jgi:hypothetical protein